MAAYVSIQNKSSGIRQKYEFLMWFVYTLIIKETKHIIVSQLGVREGNRFNHPHAIVSFILL